MPVGVGVGTGAGSAHREDLELGVVGIGMKVGEFGERVIVSLGGVWCW